MTFFKTGKLLRDRLNGKTVDKNAEDKF